MKTDVSRRAVVVSACPETRNLARSALAQSGWSCEEATDARGALILAISLEPDLILMDFRGTEGGMSAVNLLGFSRNVARVPVLTLDEGLVTIIERGSRYAGSRPVHRGRLSAELLSTLIEGAAPTTSN